MNPLLATAIRAAEAAARVHLRYFRRFDVESAREKAQSDFVTQVDVEAQEAAVAVIREAYPDHHILAEEEAREEGPAVRPAQGIGAGESAPGTPAPVGPGSARRWPGGEGFLWIIDPLDGTTNYLHGHPMFGASVAVGRASGAGEPGEANAGLTLRGRLEAGAVVAPRTQERWWALRGGGAWKNGLPIAVSPVRELKKAMIGTGFPFKEPDLLPRYTEQFRRVLPNTGGIRRCGSAALDLCYLAEGILDGFWEEDYLSPWDVAAGLIILSEAGGNATRLDGSALDLEDGSILAGNSPGILGGLGALLRDAG